MGPRLRRSSRRHRAQVLTADRTSLTEWFPRQVAVTMQEQETAAPVNRDGSKTPEMPAPSEPQAPKVHPELAEFDVPERILFLIESLPDVQDYILDLHKTFRSYKTATAALQQARKNFQTTRVDINLSKLNFSFNLGPVAVRLGPPSSCPKRGKKLNQ